MVPRDRGDRLRIAGPAFLVDIFPIIFRFRFFASFRTNQALVIQEVPTGHVPSDMSRLLIIIRIDSIRRDS